MVSDQNMNSMVSALEVTDSMFTIKATFCGLVANNEKNAPAIWKKGAPGGWPTCSFAEVEIYSPQSQKLREGSTVRVNTTKAMAKRHHPVMVFHFLKEIWFILISRVLLSCKENGLNDSCNGEIFFLNFFI